MSRIPNPGGAAAGIAEALIPDCHGRHESDKTRRCVVTQIRPASMTGYSFQGINERFSPSELVGTMRLDLKVMASHLCERGGELLSAATLRYDRDEWLFARLTADAHLPLCPLPADLKLGGFVTEFG